MAKEFLKITKKQRGSFEKQQAKDTPMHSTTSHSCIVKANVLLQTTPDNEEAVRWFREAATQGHADAQHNFGVMWSLDRNSSA
jgi:hypothetical protein